MLVNELSGASQVETEALHQSTRTLLRYWERLCIDGAVPSRAQLDLKQIVAIAPDLMIVERRNGFRFRLAGTRICAMLRREMTGTDVLADFDRFETNIVRQLLNGVLDTLKPCLLRLRLQTSVGETFDAEMIAVPIRAKDGESMHIFGGIFPIQDISRLVYDSIAILGLAGVRSVAPQPSAGRTRAFSVIQGGLAR